jgi:hypothetical protein
VARSVTALLADFTIESLGGSGSRDRLTLGCSFAQAIRYYLSERDSGRAGWRYPSFMSAVGSDSTAAVETHFCIEGRIWDELTDEAGRQRVTPDELLRHAVLFFVADRETGRVARRIFERVGV